MDFYRIAEREANKNGVIEVFPDFRVCRSKDLMVRGRGFYAIWDEAAGLWSTDEYDVQRLIDEDLLKYQANHPGAVTLKLMGNFSSNSWLQFRNYVGHLSDSNTQLDESLTFANTVVKKEDYVSRRLPYSLEPGDISAYKEMFELLYEPEELAKLEWAVGAIISGDAKNIQKFLVLYGEGGTGKSTWLNLIQDLFDGYYAAFEAKALTGTNNAFATEAFKSNPLVAIQHDGDLSKIEDNTKLNSIISHEYMTMNEKYKPAYMARSNAMLLMGTNKPVKITDGKSGIIRRLIDVRPTGEKHSSRKYQALVSQMHFELGAIAHHCLEVYREMGKNYYSGYRPVEMMLQTDIFFNFIESNYDLFKAQDGATLAQAFELYKMFCDESLVEYKLARHKFRDEFRNYFHEFHDRYELPDGTRPRSWFQGFKAEHFKVKTGEDPHAFSLVMDEEESLFDALMASQPAQYSNEEGTPTRKWENVTATLGDIDTTKEHFVKVPTSHIVIDFDLKDADGNKSAERNLEAASAWPSTYAEFSKSGHGIHLHYNYTGDPDDLARVYDDGIEIKVFTGNSSLRRRMSRCNTVPVASISSGLPLREKKVISEETIKSEKALRDLIERNLRKEIHPGTKPSVDFIYKILEDAYASGLSYDVTNMRSRILTFANNSTNQALAALKMVSLMQFKSEDVIEDKAIMPTDERLWFYDVEVYPNLFVVCYKHRGADKVVRLINPTAQAVEQLFAKKLVGFNCRRYDNHIMYAAAMGYNNEQLYKLSQKIISNAPNPYFAQAYNLSYTDIFDYNSKKQSLKKWEIELGVNHVESELPWDEPVPPELWDAVADYCENDVNATEAVFEATIQDFVARQILADLSGLSVNATTNSHSQKIIFGEDKFPQEKFKYTHLEDMFPGYRFDMGTSYYRDEITGEGGYVYAEPGSYENVALLDVASMHPTSIEQLNLFGEYTEKFSDLKRARMAIKHKDYDRAKEMLGGKLARHLTDDNEAKALSDALKIVINSVYGLTSAKFENSFRDPRNIDNIVAKRGALFMIDLKHFVQEQGFTVAHIKTDSIKIPNATPEIIAMVMEFGKKYGYDFEHEATYEKFCLVNDAVYVAYDGKKWTAVGAQFAHPYVFKTLFSHEPVKFEDLGETKTVTTALYLDFGVEKGVPWEEEKHFVGRAGLFVPVLPGTGGGALLRLDKDGEKFHAAVGSKNFLWKEAEQVKKLKQQGDIDYSYYEGLVYEARETLARYGDVDIFLS